MFDNPKKELEKLEKQLLEDEEWFRRELDSAKRMIGQVPAKQRPSAPRTPQATKAAPQPVPSRGAESKTHAGSRPAPANAPVKKKKGVQGLLILACAEILGILGLAAYWMLVLLK